MKLRTLARDCLYLNWAVPLDAAPPLPYPLRYEVHHDAGDPWVFASALLFRFSGLHLRAMPVVRLSYPQMNLRLYVVDGNGVPSVLFVRLLVPSWVVPGSRWIGRQPATAARLSFPEPSRDPMDDAWRWEVRSTTRFGVVARRSTPRLGPGPQLGSWERAVEHFRYRVQGYAMWTDRLRRVTASRPSVAVWPLQVDLEHTELLCDALPGVDPAIWTRPHSAWLCPEIPFIFELGKPRAFDLLPGVGAAGFRRRPSRA